MNSHKYPLYLILLFLSTNLHPMLVLHNRSNDKRLRRVHAKIDPYVQFLALPTETQDNAFSSMTPAKLYDILPQDAKKEVWVQLLKLQTVKVETKYISDELTTKPLPYTLCPYLKIQEKLTQYPIITKNGTQLSFVNYIRLNVPQCAVLCKATQDITPSNNNKSNYIVLTEIEIKTLATLDTEIKNNTLNAKTFKSDLSLENRIMTFLTRCDGIKILSLLTAAGYAFLNPTTSTKQKILIIPCVLLLMTSCYFCAYKPALSEKIAKKENIIFT